MILVALMVVIMGAICGILYGCQGAENDSDVPASRYDPYHAQFRQPLYVPGVAED